MAVCALFAQNFHPQFHRIQHPQEILPYHGMEVVSHGKLWRNGLFHAICYFIFTECTVNRICPVGISATLTPVNFLIRTIPHRPSFPKLGRIFDDRIDAESQGLSAVAGRMFPTAIMFSIWCLSG
jgi:hypothetical protein